MSLPAKEFPAVVSQRRDARLPFYLFFVILAVYALAIYGQFLLLGTYIPEGSIFDLMPKSLAEIPSSAVLIRETAQTYPLLVGLLFVSLFVFKQTFSVPGGLLLNVIAGIAFGLPLGLIIVIIFGSVGASGAFLVSYAFGDPLLDCLSCCGVRNKLGALRLRIDAAARSNSLFFYFAGMRMVTIFPQWVINLCSPHIGIPFFKVYLPATMLGALPYNFISVRAGALLSLAAAAVVTHTANIDGGRGGGLAPLVHGEEAPPSLNKQHATLTFSDVFSDSDLLVMAGVAVALFLIPPLVMKRFEASLLKEGERGGELLASQPTSEYRRLDRCEEVPLASPLKGLQEKYDDSGPSLASEKALDEIGCGGAPFETAMPTEVSRR